MYRTLCIIGSLCVSPSLQLLASAGAAAPAARQVVSAQEIRTMQQALEVARRNMIQNNTETNIQLFEKADTELYENANKCPHLDQETKAIIANDHQDNLVIIYQRRQKNDPVNIERRRFIQKQYNAQDMRESGEKEYDTLNTQYRTMEQELARLRKLFPARQEPHYDFKQCDAEGWTPFLKSLALSAGAHTSMLEQRALLLNRTSAQTQLAQSGASFSGTTRCLVVRSPFAPAQRTFIKKASQLAPYTALYYIHSQEELPIMVIPITAEREQFESLNKPIIEPDKDGKEYKESTNHKEAADLKQYVTEYQEGYACAFIEYLNQLKAHCPLKITTINSNLGQFYKQHDDYQRALKDATKNGMNQLGMKDEANIIFGRDGIFDGYSGNEHPARRSHRAQPAPACHPK